MISTDPRSPGTDAMRKSTLFAWLLGPLLFIPLACAPNLGPSGVPPGTPTVRVLLLENRQTVSLSASAAPTVRVGGGSSQRLNFPSGSSVAVSLNASGWQIGNASLGSGEMVLEPSVEGSLSVGAAKVMPYRGRMRFVPSGGDRFDVVNDVDVEGYLKGVLAKEMLHNWRLEAYEAQAIVARTYALYEARTGSTGRAFDLYPDQRSQVYGGVSAESATSRQAVEATRGVVVAYGPPGHEKIFKAYFSSCCGGVTQSAADAFGDPASPPLSDQLIGPCCVESPHFNWGPVVIQKSELSRRIRAWATNHQRAERDIGQVTRVDVQFANQFGRPTRFVVSDDRGTRYSFTSEDFRVAFNTGATDGVTIPSGFFKPVNEAYVIRLVDGHGFGHGVGLCQWCAEHKASQGVRPEAIVTAAYPHSRLIRAY